MPFTRSRIERYLDRNLPPLHLTGENQRIGREPLPEQYAEIQKWVISMGRARPHSYVPDLTCVLQGVGELMIAASGKHNKFLTEEEILREMQYVTWEEDFQGGALKQFPELWGMLRTALNELPQGPKVLDIIKKSKKYDYLKW